MTLKSLEKRLFDFAGRNCTMAEALTFHRRRKLGEVVKDTCGDMEQVRPEAQTRTPKL